MKSNRVYYGIFSISLATLALEISLIRFFSISQWYHFAFMVISIALFGIAASGTFLTIRKINNPLFISSVLFSLSALTGFFIANSLIFDPFKAITDFSHIFVLLVYYISLGLPFFFFGVIIAYSFSTLQKYSGKVYFYNMAGSAAGTLASLFFISVFNVKTIFVISLLGLLSSLFFIGNTTQKKHNVQKIAKKMKNNDIIKKKIIFLLIIINLLIFFIPISLNISKYKELSQALNVPNSRLIGTKYNSFSRVDIVNSSFTRYAPGLSPAFKGNLPEQIGITIDAGSMNSITKYGDLHFIDNLPSSLPYFLNNYKNKKALIINSGAGLDVLAALKYNATATAIESNPIIISLLKNNYADFSGNIYNNAEVIFGEGRSFIKNSKEKYDVIMLSLAGNVLSSSAGISGLSENYLLTKEAFEDYYGSLTEDGLLVVTRWLLFPPRESLRLFSLALEIDDEAKKTAMFRSWTTVTLVLSKKNLDKTAMAKIKDFIDKNRFDIIYLPSDFTPNKNLKFKEPYYYNAVQNLLQNKSNFYRGYIFDVRPVTDNKPFYFNFFKISKISELGNLTNQKWNPLLDSGFLLFFMLIQALILALIFILLPIKFFNAQKNSKGIFGAQKISSKFSREARISKKAKKGPLAYFFAIGIGYLFVEISLMQKFILFLGHVIFSSSAIIFSMLLFSSLGALYSQKFRVKALKSVISIVFISIVFYLFALDFIIEYFISMNLILKTILAVLITAPLGFIIGFPFPLGIRAIKKELIACAWAVNGSASVLSPILAVMLALFFGYAFVLFLAGLAYLAGYLFSTEIRHPQS